jgi:hypothetical protein
MANIKIKSCEQKKKPKRRGITQERTGQKESKQKKY